MQPTIKSLRPFIGAKDFNLSLQFYKKLGWEPVYIPKDMYYISIGDNFGFYLQNYYNADWVNNTMLFLEIEDVPAYYDHIKSLELESQFPGVKLHPIRHEPWGMEFFLTDPSTVLWHFGRFEGDGM